MNFFDLVLGVLLLLGASMLLLGTMVPLWLWYIRGAGVLIVALESRSSPAGDSGSPPRAIPLEEEIPWWKGTDITPKQLRMPLPADLEAVRNEALRRCHILMAVWVPLGIVCLGAGVVGAAMISRNLR